MEENDWGKPYQKKQSTDWTPKTELTKTKKPSRIVEVYSIGRPLVIEESSQVKSINSIYKYVYQLQMVVFIAAAATVVTTADCNCCWKIISV